jgi:FKBP-type peptidyl-prolyl cis-trans isomerase FklB
MTMMRSLFQILALLSLLFAVFAGTSEEGLAWLAEKAKEEGVVKLPSGLMYKELKAGTGKTPAVNSPTKCHYSGTLIDGTEFDSSYKRGQPLTFAPNQVIKGWTEAMQVRQLSLTVERLPRGHFHGFAIHSLHFFSHIPYSS